ncbi:zinc finger MYM-type 1-like [Paramuricea clavata]|uniref:Zinc finger MYM-type 1-like n=1 Tax=Paramuricea clavata TaxID=317549 RepID=A0A7D9LNI5_PARCT|nr:zinc finger MYM-type 1-like [Paramuricea clavata]
MKGSRGKNKPGKLQTHFSCDAHTAAIRDYAIFVREGNHIDELLSKQQRRSIIDDESEKNREVIEMLIDVTKTLTRNGIALRGNDSDEDGNFRQIVYLLSRHNPVMKAWLENRSMRKYHTTYLSPQSQNEFISLLGDEVRSQISSCVKDAGFCSVMADTTPDVSHSDEPSVAVRYVDVDSCLPKERLVRVVETKDKTGAGQAEDIVKCLKLSHIPLSTVMFQTYDSTASMSGRFNGAQQKLSEMLERKIPYTKCTPHGVNLVVEHGCSASPLIGKVFAVLEKIFVFFTDSPKRNQHLKEKSEEVGNYLQLRNLSKTRWTARPESVEAVWRGLEAILSALDAITKTGDPDSKTKAAGLINMILNIDFICGIMFLKNVMYKTKSLADYLQGETVDIASALIAMESTHDCLRRIRMADKEIDDQILAAIEVARNLGVDPIADFSRLHRVRRPSRRLDDQPETTAVELTNVSTFYRAEFFKFMDQMCTTLMEKQIGLKDTFNPFLKVLHPETIQNVQELVGAFPSAFSQESSSALHSELSIFFEYALKEHRRMEKERQSQAAPAVLKNERSFSLLKIVKSCSRNKISGERLNDCTILAAEKDITDVVDVTAIAKKWSILKNRPQAIA